MYRGYAIHELRFVNFAGSSNPDEIRGGIVRRLRRTLTFLASALTLTAGMSLAVANPAAAYSPGRSIAYRPVYSVGADGWSWHCGYAGWRSGAKVSWTCRLYEIYLDDGGWENVTIAVHKGSWTPGSSSHTTPTWVRKLTIGDGELCVEAYALSVDGGATNRVCAS
jgi:hypothetical protein